MEPARAAARSERMSACRLVATIVSSDSGCRTMRTVMASTVSSVANQRCCKMLVRKDESMGVPSMWSSLTSGKSFATSLTTSSHMTMPER